MQSKRVMFVLPCMKGGGAERVAALLANEFHKAGIETSVVLTSSTPESVIRVDLDEAVPLKCLCDVPTKENIFGFLGRRIAHICSATVCKCYEKLKKAVPASWAYLSFWSQYGNEIKKLRSILRKDPELRVISFLQPSIPMTVLAARGLPNRIIISERGDPRRLMKKRYGYKFVEKFYSRADRVVFQTFDAKNAYPECISKKGVVISNPIKADLPLPYSGERNKNITTFCRISAQKNLPVLFEAFWMLNRDHPEYKLRVIGDALNEEGVQIEAQLKQFVRERGLMNTVVFEPFMTNVHEAMISDAMYVNSSDYEGISNAMLEAMAIGLPVVCTDCPIGGAKSTITDGVNGLLVPIGDSERLYQAMKRLVENPDFAESLSKNATTLREELKLNRIAQEWLELL